MGLMKTLEIALSSQARSSLAVVQERLAKQIRIQVVPPSAIEALQVAATNSAWTQIEQVIVPALRSHHLMMESVTKSLRPSLSVTLSALPSLNFSALYQGLEVTQQWKTLTEQIYEQVIVDLSRFGEVADFPEELSQDSPSTSIELADDHIKLVMGLAIWIALHVYIVVGDDSENVFLGVAVSIIDLLTAPTALKAIKDFNEFLSGYDPT